MNGVELAIFAARSLGMGIFGAGVAAKSPLCVSIGAMVIAYLW